MSRHVIISFILSAVVCNATYAQTSINLTATKIKTGDRYTADPEILYELGKPTLKKESYPLLDSIASFILKHSQYVFEIGTHCDSRVADIYINLTMVKSARIAEYLISKGVPEDRLIPKGYSQWDPIVTEEEIGKLKTEEEIEMAHAKNRRTTFTVVAERK